MNKKILILNTGGTISSMKTEAGYQPVPGHVTEALRAIPAFSHADMPAYEVHEYTPLLDSSNLTCDDWNRIASDIETHYDAFDGFVIFHGTDTMAYTASALSFMLEHLNKPVILTGSQIPLSEVRNDAVENALTAVWLCAHRAIHEVCVYFNQRLLRGNRTQKISSARFNAFDSPNFPHLAEVGAQINMASGLLLPQSQQPFHKQPLRSAAIASFRLWPGISFDLLDALLHMPIEALVLETYGAGNAPNQITRFLDMLKAASDRGIILINSSQCTHGAV
ncbi:MAG: asparaginase domain-containing protein, partial [Gammaproteobacteria bacterium]|nr:asparaginase domain-containing protein [Gammaproteobacteria bacterium]